MIKETEKPSIQVATQAQVEITSGDLPLSCPTKEMTLWNAHPRVYLPIEETGKVDCPYCGTHYTLASASK